MHLGRRVTEDTPVLLAAEVARALPQVVVGVEEVDVVTNRLLERGDSSALVARRSNGDTVGLALRRPARLDNSDRLVTTASLPNTLDLLNSPGTGLAGGDTAVEESVGVDSHVVAVLAELRVLDNSNEGVDRDDRTRVAGRLKSSTALSDVVADLGRSSGARVDELVTDADGGDITPVAVEAGVHGRDARGNVSDVVDTEEKLLAGSLGSVDVGNLVAVSAVQTDDRETAELGNVVGNLAGRLAATAASVGAVGDTKGASAASRDTRAGGRGRGLGGRGGLGGRSLGSSGVGGDSGGGDLVGGLGRGDLGGDGLGLGNHSRGDGGLDGGVRVAGGDERSLNNSNVLNGGLTLVVVVSRLGGSSLSRKKAEGNSRKRRNHK